MFLGRETLENHSQLPTNAAFGRLQAFRMYGGIGMSASSLHRESTDSLIPTGSAMESLYNNIDILNMQQVSSAPYHPLVTVEAVRCECVYCTIK